MLKRFMTWLLNKLQKIAGALSGKRAQPTPRNREPDRPDLPNDGLPSDGLDSSDITVAERVSYVPPVSTPPSQESGTPQTDAHQADTPQSDPPLKDFAAARSLDSISEATTDKLEIRDRLNAAASSVSGLPETKPSLPTEVSTLLSSAEQTVEETMDVPVHPIENLSDDLLPAIHDLLPAVPKPEHAQDIFQSEPSIDHSQDDEDAADAAEESLESQSAQDSVSAEDSRLNEAEQPIVFSFDIVESEENENEAVQAHEDQPLEEQAYEDKLFEDRPLEDRLIEDETTLEESESKAESIEPAREVEALPYPWSMATPNVATSDSASAAPESALQPAPESLNSPKQPEQIDVSDQTETLSSQPQQAAAPSIEDSTVAESSKSDNPADSRSTKQGTIKLLFTMKKGNFHGYIAPDDGSKDILFHQKYINADIFPKLERGAQVSATVKYIEGKAYATHVDLV